MSADKEIALARHLPAGDDTTGDSLLDQLRAGFAALAEHNQDHDDQDHPLTTTDERTTP